MFGRKKGKSKASKRGKKKKKKEDLVQEEEEEDPWKTIEDPGVAATAAADKARQPDYHPFEGSSPSDGWKGWEQNQNNAEDNFRKKKQRTDHLHQSSVAVGKEEVFDDDDGEKKRPNKSGKKGAKKKSAKVGKKGNAKLSKKAGETSKGKSGKSSKAKSGKAGKRPKGKKSKTASQGKKGKTDKAPKSKKKKGGIPKEEPLELSSSYSKVDAGVKLCDICHHHRPNILCQDEGLVFCLECCTDHHKRGSAVKHTRIPIPLGVFDDHNKMCDECEEVEADVWCEQEMCAYCDECSLRLHRKAARKHHLLVMYVDYLNKNRKLLENREVRRDSDPDASAEPSDFPSEDDEGEGEEDAVSASESGSEESATVEESSGSSTAASSSGTNDGVSSGSAGSSASTSASPSGSSS